MTNSYNKSQFRLLLPENISSQTIIYLTESIYSIGRHSDSNIQLNSGAVSRNHATLMRTDLPSDESSYILIDGDLKGQRSQNGILVNGKRTIYHKLKDGDVIIFGSSEIKAIYQQEKFLSEELISHDNLLPNMLIKETSLSFDLARDKLQDTLILSEENLHENLNKKDIKRLASFPELSPNPIIEFDFNGKIIYTNPAANVCIGELFTDDILINP
ncbi:FHA domain-containing protein [Geminocystis sp. GBBB08]|uniref:FHA domain-containing protein n=1 Tax=Geminocystis sp. GBBB08 TaxID=2604140 RepID=UPI0027E2DAF7|nr:FHA domain-containing protein [Geminocystis sp. GBBB08]